MKRLSLLVLSLIFMVMPVLAQVGMEFGPVESDNVTRFVDFKMMKDGNKVPYFGLTADDCRCFEIVNGDTVELYVDSLVDISSRKLVSKNLTIGYL